MVRQPLPQRTHTYACMCSIHGHLGDKLVSDQCNVHHFGITSYVRFFVFFQRFDDILSDMLCFEATAQIDLWITFAESGFKSGSYCTLFILMTDLLAFNI